MDPIGFPDLPHEARYAMRDVPGLIQTATAFIRGAEGRCYVRIGKPALERGELLRLVNCPVFARVMSEQGGLMLQFDATPEATARRELTRQRMHQQRGG